MRTKLTTKGPSGTAVNAPESLQYDAIGRLTNDATFLDSFAYTYADATSRFSARTSAAGPQVAALYFPPQQDGLLEQLSYVTPSGSALAQYAYTYDALHNVTSSYDSTIGTTTLYTYDAYNQLSTMFVDDNDQGGVTPDPSGNIESLWAETHPSRYDFASLDNEFSYDAANKLTQDVTYQSGPVSYPPLTSPIACDKSTGSLDTIGSAAWVYSYDASNRLSAFSSYFSADSSSFLYDGLGRLSEVVDSSPAADHSYIWCEERMCLEVDNTQQVAVPGSTQTTALPDAFYVSQGAVNNPVGVVAGNVPTAQLAYDVTDLLGSERAVVTNNALVAEYEYDTFGNQSVASGSSIASNRGFTGFYYHAASGLQFARNRVYNSALARWMTRDPIGYGHAFDNLDRFNATDLNLYAYAGNNPQSNVDPSGILVSCRRFSGLRRREGRRWQIRRWRSRWLLRRAATYARPATPRAGRAAHLHSGWTPIRRRVHREMHRLSRT